MKGNLMGSQSKMRYYLKEVEAWQKLVDEFEEYALSRAKELVDTDPRYKDHDPWQAAASSLRTNFRYNRAVALKNEYREKVKMYALLTIAGVQ